MASFIIYCRNADNLHRTLCDLVDKTPPQVLQEIILCDDGPVGLSAESYLYDDVRHKITVIASNCIGKSQAWNRAGRLAKSSHLVFLTQAMKFGSDWWLELEKQFAPKRLLSPVTYPLDVGLWATESHGCRRYGMRWDLSVYNRKLGSRSPLAAYCMIIEKDFWEQIGGFDDQADVGPGDNICLSLKVWMAGGEIVVVDDSYVAVVHEVEAGSKRNLARLVEAWFPKYAGLFYDMAGIARGSLDLGRLNNLVQFAESSERSSQEWLENLHPELLGVHKLRGLAQGERIAIVGDGPSLDYINWSTINSHDLVIAIDYIGLLFDCDFVVTESLDVVSELRAKYSDKQLIVPYVLEHKIAGEYVTATEAVPGATAFELGEIGQVNSEFPPFCNFGTCVHMALHLALFMQPRSISLFACDNKIIAGKSHTSRSEFYNGGEIWADSDHSRKRFSFYEVGVAQLSKLALRLGIPVIRIGHA